MKCFDPVFGFSIKTFAEMQFSNVLVTKYLFGFWMMKDLENVQGNDREILRDETLYSGPYPHPCINPEKI